MFLHRNYPCHCPQADVEGGDKVSSCNRSLTRVHVSALPFLVSTSSTPSMRVNVRAKISLTRTVSRGWVVVARIMSYNQFGARIASIVLAFLCWLGAIMVRDCASFAILSSRILKNGLLPRLARHTWRCTDIRISVRLMRDTWGHLCIRFRCSWPIPEVGFPVVLEPKGRPCSDANIISLLLGRRDNGLVLTPLRLLHKTSRSVQNPLCAIQWLANDATCASVAHANRNVDYDGAAAPEGLQLS